MFAVPIRLAAPIGLVLWGLAGCAADPGPELTSVTPASAALGANVVLTGLRLCGSSGDCETAGGAVEIGTELPAIIATIVTYDDTTATITIPTITPVGPTTIEVDVNDTTSNAIAFEVAAQ